MAESKDKSGDKSLLAGVVVTLALAAGVIFSVHRSAIPPSANPKINPEQIRALIDKGAVSEHPAEYFEEMVPQ